MKKYGWTIVTLVVIGGVLFFVDKQIFDIKKTNTESGGIVFLGDNQYEPSFDQSAKSAKAFSELFEEGLNHKKAGDYTTAIKLFNECLPHVALGPEVAMIYKQLSEIYRVQGNLEKELFCLEEIPRYTMSDRIKKESLDRAAEIRTRLLAVKPKMTATVNEQITS